MLEAVYQGRRVWLLVRNRPGTTRLGMWLLVAGMALVAGAAGNWLRYLEGRSGPVGFGWLALTGALLAVTGLGLGPLEVLRRLRQRPRWQSLLASLGLAWLLGVTAWHAGADARKPDGALRQAVGVVWAALDGRGELVSAAEAVGRAVWQVAAKPHVEAVRSAEAVAGWASEWGVPRRLGTWLWWALWAGPAAVALLVERQPWRWLWWAPPSPVEVAVAWDPGSGPDVALLRPRRPDENAFADLVDVDEAVETLQAALSAWLQAREAAWFGIKPPKGILLHGPPGTGKTSLARAAARWSGLNFLAVSTAELLGQVVGETERRVREVFQRARRLAPCIVFLDEIDAIGRRRDGHHLNRPSDLALPVLLQEMDGFEPLHGVLVLAATNRPDVLDEALLRRFEQKVYVGPPEPKGMAILLERHLAGLPLEDFNLIEAGARLKGISPALVEAACQHVRRTLWLEYRRTGQRRAVRWEDVARGLLAASGVDLDSGTLAGTASPTGAGGA